VPRPRRKPRPPGSIRVVCTGRDSHDLVRFRPPLQLYNEGTRLRIKWDSRQGTAPVTPFHAADDLRTFEHRCGTCNRHWKRREDDLEKLISAVVEFQGIRSGGNTPITLDISCIERA
jgi:hypothetical protein